jgi:hypothetical protein
MQRTTPPEVDCPVDTHHAWFSAMAAGYLVDEADVTFRGVRPACHANDQPRETA